MPYKDKTQNRNYNREYYKKNRDKLLPKIRERVIEWQKQNKEHISDKNKMRREKQRDQMGITKNAISSKRYRDRLKVKVFKQLGNKCNCCGETEFEFLVIDHVDNNGAEDRRSNKRINGGAAIYRHIIKSGYPSGYQILCCNCNFSKHLGHGECIHKRRSQ